MEQQSFGEWLKEQRTNCDLSQEKAGKRIGVSGAAISRWEAEIDAPDPSRYEAIEGTYFLPKGTIERMLKPPAEGPSLDYWVGRWEQQTLHLRRLLMDQEDLLATMREKAGSATTPTVTREDMDAVGSAFLAGHAPADKAPPKKAAQ